MAVCPQNMAPVTVTVSNVFCWVYYNNLTSSPFLVFAPKGRCTPYWGGRSPQTKQNYVLFLNSTTMRRQQAGAQSLLLPPGSFCAILPYVNIHYPETPTL